MQRGTFENGRLDGGDIFLGDEGLSFTMILHNIFEVDESRLANADIAAVIRTQDKQIDAELLGILHHRQSVVALVGGGWRESPLQKLDQVAAFHK